MLRSKEVNSGVMTEEIHTTGIEISALTHTYEGGHTALSGVDLELGTGLYGLLGPNGAGKSTLMRIICALLNPTSGSVQVGGYDTVTERFKVRSLLGYLPQDFGGWRLHRVEEVLDTLAQLSGLHNKRFRKQRVTAVLEEVGLSSVRDRKLKKLSGGMVRRLGVAQALVHEPPILIVDEPTVGLDPEERIRFRQLMGAIGRDRTVLLSTHIVGDLGAACREIALLDHGRISFKGQPKELVAAARDRVFEMETGLETAENIELNYEIVSRRTSGDQVLLRGIAPEVIPEGSRPVQEPTLEEAYMAFMAQSPHSLDAAQNNRTEETLTVEPS